MPEKTELAPREEISPEVLRPVASPDQLVEAFRILQEVKRKLITAEDLYLDDRGDERLKISGWRKFGIAFGLTLEIARETRQQDDLKPENFTWRIGVKARARGGREVIGVGSFSSRELKFKVLEDGSIVHPTKTDKSGAPVPVPLEHLVYSRAHTRAIKRAIQDMIGPVEQEEEDLQEPEPAKAPPPAPAPPRTTPTPKAGQQRVDAGQRAIAVRFLEEVLGEDLLHIVELEDRDGALLVTLPRPYPEELGKRFTKAMWNIGQGIHESAAGIHARMQVPKV